MTKERGETMSEKLDAATLNQLEMDAADSAYEEQCWREDMAELHGWDDKPHPTLEEFLKADRKNRRES